MGNHRLRRPRRRARTVIAVLLVGLVAAGVGTAAVLADRGVEPTAVVAEALAPETAPAASAEPSPTRASQETAPPSAAPSPSPSAPPAEDLGAGAASDASARLAAPEPSPEEPSEESGGSGGGSGGDAGDSGGEAVTTSGGGSCEASSYGDPQPTASGETFDPTAMTAAHRTLPFDTRVQVTNPDNGRSVIVRINDRGPYIDGRCLDLSTAAFEEIASLDQGVVDVEWAIVEE
ncbi:septal ring lytic transglycosylase RlpA family protein [Allonocardiopsis opalescens]|uniref:Probable endolytic peptidoglycan transglycosylase RlpA n=1 Tax=Allonocardiopsis opalescens TaxID=1144618 RepID=A0A2T0Q5I1_9ACTN|nr:septal ring lytic transglycosylase RlpA family protein [Allonocardiopsis opalescens]PRX99078.1 rare lipoprotein A [Allonocardiopsis opalescens]